MAATNISAILLIHCEDKPGIVAEVSTFLHSNKGNIIRLDEHVDRAEKIFFMRAEWELENFSIEREEIGKEFKAKVAEKFNMNWQLFYSDEIPRAAVFVSKLNHGLFDIFSNVFSENWKMEIPVIVGNHETLKPIVEKFGIKFCYIPVNPADKTKHEKQQIELMAEYKIDLIILARYMQIIGPEFIRKYENKIINIHHSFLPAFPGAKPYHSAHERGVKIIGATSHYVTEDLDAGPIIEQDVVHVTHKDSVSDLIRKGRDLEKMVLSRAIWLHLNRRILVYKNRTVVF